MSSSNSTHDTKTLADLRAALFATLEGVKAGTLDLDRARAVNEIGKTLIDSAKVEVAFAQVTGQNHSAFIAPDHDANNALPALPNGIVGITRHRLQG